MATFGELLRRYRLSSGLSQDELAGRSTVSVRTISSLENDAGKTPHSKTARILAAALQLTHAEQQEFLTASAGNSTSDAQFTEGSRAFRQNRLPIPPNQTVGRHGDIASIAKTLTSGDHRIVTLTGTGGVGKTRLAIAAASKIATHFDLGAHYLPLENVTDADDLPGAIAASFGLSTTDRESLRGRLSALLGEHTILILLDNFEQIIEAAPVVQGLVGGSSSITVLVTSRAPLRVSDEIEFPVNPLPIAEQGASAEDLANSAAVKLFLNRSPRGQDHEDIPLSEADVQTIAEICRRLDGLPLAIELAAARTRTFQPELLLDRLDKALPVLTDGPRDAHPRLQSMANAIAWSYDLLTLDEQWLFRSLSVFEGGFTLEAAEVIAGLSNLKSDTVLDVMSSLAEHGLIRPVQDAHFPRYVMFETIREYGLEKVKAAGEERDARNRHLYWITGKINLPTPEDWWTVSSQEKPELRDERYNLRSAFRWALRTDDVNSALSIAYALFSFWRHSAYFREGVEFLDLLIDPKTIVDRDHLAGILFASFQLAYQLGDFERCRVRGETVLRICRESNRTDRIPASLQQLSMVTRWSDPELALLLHAESISLCRVREDTRKLGQNLWQRSFTYLSLGNVEKALIDYEEWALILEQHSELKDQHAWFLLNGAWLSILTNDIAGAEKKAIESLEIAVERELPDCEAIALWILGEIARDQNRLHLALEYAQQALEIRNRMALELWEGFSLAQIAGILVAAGDRNQASVLYGAAESSWYDLGIADSVKSGARWFSRFRPPDDLMEQGEFRASFAAGEGLPRGDAISRAMSVSIGPAHDPGGHPKLSNRELEVLRYLAQGSTNLEIADRLFISKRTVDSHVSSILRKLDVQGRREALSVAGELDLL